MKKFWLRVGNYMHPEISETFSNLVGEETNIEKFENLENFKRRLQV